LKHIQGAHVLLVEDNEINQQVASEILQGAGLKVSLATNGQEAINAIQEDEYDAVLMDVQMPVMDGYTATRKVREWEGGMRKAESGIGSKKDKISDANDPQPVARGQKPLPIIAMTAHAMAGDAEKSIAAGMSDHITKPIDPVQLFATLQKWIQPDKSRAAVEQQKPPSTTESPTKIVSDAEGLPESLPGFDLADGLNRLQGNKKLYRKLLLDLSAKYAGIADDIRQALDARDFEQARSLVHNIKGLAGNLAAIDLQAAAVKLEKGVKGGLQKGFSEEKLNQSFAEFKKAFQAALSSVQILGPSPAEETTQPATAALAEIPAELAKKAADRIREAAEMGDVTRIKSIAGECRSQSERFAPIADRIIDLTSDFDFDGILKIADQLTG
jgi:CheY-like chemotaxis protein/HPt (histidine-containing phosphotransfer) domain-containing protein